MTYSPTVKRRRLSSELRKQRIAADLDPKEVAKRLGIDVSKLYRMERGDWSRPDPLVVKALMDLYGIADEREREALLTLARESRQRGWWADYSDVFRGSLPDFESGASVIRNFEALLIPGLLQKPDYTRAIFRAAAVDEEAIERHVEARNARQQILSRPSPPHLWVVIDEAALRRLVGGPDVMRAQLEHIIKMGDLPNVAVQVLLSSAGAHAAMAGGFVILDFPEPDPSLVCMETATDTLYLEQATELQRYTVIYSHVQAAALSTEESARYVESLVKRL